MGLYPFLYLWRNSPIYTSMHTYLVVGFVSLGCWSLAEDLHGSMVIDTFIRVLSQTRNQSSSFPVSVFLGVFPYRSRFRGTEGRVISHVLRLVYDKHVEKWRRDPGIT